jgi:hypothetical protein
MNRKTLLLLLALTSARAAVGQQLLCPIGSSTSGKPCDTFHFHVLMFRPDTKDFAEFIGINQFASQSSCEQAREAQTKQNLTVVDYMKKAANNLQYEADRVGPCHCDMTVERTSPNFLTDAQRVNQVRMAEEVRKHVRERLLDAHVPSDSDLIRGLNPPPAVNPILNGPRVAPLPSTTSAISAINTPEDLRATRSVHNTPQVTTSFDLPLSPIVIAGISQTSGASATVAASQQSAVSGSPSTAPTTNAPQPPAGSVPSSVASTANPVAAPNAPDSASTAVSAAGESVVDDPGDAFISAETERIQNVLKSSSAVTDDATRMKILEACMERIQVLSNLRTLIQGSGAHSRLGTAARNARDESNRLALAARLFGNDMAAHWAPKEPAGVILDPQPDVESHFETVLRDSGTRFSQSQKKRALYLFLGRARTTEEQQLWLIPVVDNFLE